MNILTGKCKEDFEEWLYKQEWYDTLDFGCNNANMWEYSPFSMQYGVLVDFFDIVGIYVDTQYFKENKIYFESSVTYNGWNHAGDLSNRQEARKQAIGKANELYNKNND